MVFSIYGIALNLYTAEKNPYCKRVKNKTKQVDLY